MTYESESIGQIGTTPWAHEFAVWYIPQVIGDPPPHCELVAKLNDHGLGEYGTIEIVWNPLKTQRPDEYIEQCEALLDVLDHDGLVNLEVLDPEYMSEYLKDRD